MKIPAVSLKGVPMPVERTADFNLHNAAGDGSRTNTPAAEEARAVLARRSRGRAFPGVGPLRSPEDAPA